MTANNGNQVKVHPAAAIFPMMSDDEIDRLAEDIRKNGQREYIVYWKGQLLDGRNRLAACDRLGIEPDICEFDEDTDTDPVAFVISANLHRRQLNESQRSLCAAKLASLSRGRPEANPQICGFTAEDAAAMFSCGTRSVETARSVLREGGDALVEQCESGDVRVSLAAKFIDAVPDKRERNRIAKEGPKAIREAIPKPPPKRVKLPTAAEECEVATVEKWLEEQDERPGFERFKAVWDSCDEMARTAIRAFVIDTTD